MLQQTQVATVIPYYERWMSRFPTFQTLAEADEEEVLAHWAGLGYYRRCRFLQAGARYVAEQGLPQTEEGWRKVPGVGRYTAGAIGSIALNLPVSLVDGNVERVFARVEGKAETGRELLASAWSWADRVLERSHPGDWNQALMELGATVCRPSNPDCIHCPIRQWCFAFQTGRQNEFPIPSVKPKVKSEAHTCWVPYCEGMFGLRQVPPGEWWEGMWEFPRVVNFDPMGSNPFPEMEDLWTEDVGLIRHSVTHHRIRLQVLLVRPTERLTSLKWFDLHQLTRLPIPAPQKRALKLARTALGVE